ncbi:hypothetical protein DPMN_178055 [Dreissena polymorpha]|uniref:Uncharacterized protein n=1 Tax=Dreissena polymorpha TaxID=45954 RepID=A0A9D4ECN9_DREPO|nr:hypothetical protein DPMN_178055 [Dreissena polymorpha]
MAIFFQFAGGHTICWLFASIENSLTNDQSLFAGGHMGIQPFFRIRKALSFKLLLEPSTDELQDDAEEEDEEEEEEEEDISPLGETTLSRSGPIFLSETASSPNSMLSL